MPPKPGEIQQNIPRIAPFDAADHQTEAAVMTIGRRRKAFLAQSQARPCPGWRWVAAYARYPADTI